MIVVACSISVDLHAAAQTPAECHFAVTEGKSAHIVLNKMVTLHVPGFAAAGYKVGHSVKNAGSEHLL